MSRRRERASGRASITCATPSICPDSRCPPSGSPARSAGSRFTAAPGTSSPSVVSASVSRERPCTRKAAREAPGGGAAPPRGGGAPWRRGAPPPGGPPPAPPPGGGPASPCTSLISSPPSRSSTAPSESRPFTSGADSMRAALAVSRMPDCTSLRSEEHTSELQSRLHLVCRLLLEKKKKNEHQH